MAQEIWKNPTSMDIWVPVSEKRTGKLRLQKVPPAGGTISIDEEDRRDNVSRHYFDPSANVFTNGSLIPVKLIDSAEDYAEVASNPNFLSEGDIEKAIKGPVKGLRDTLEEVSNLQVAVRFQEVADDLGNVSDAKSKAIKERVTSLRPVVKTNMNDTPNTVKDGEDAYTFMDLSG